MRIGQKVMVQFHKGEIVEANDDFINTFPVLKTRRGEFNCVKFEGVGPNGNGMGVYHIASIMVRYINPWGNR